MTVRQKKLGPSQRRAARREVDAAEMLPITIEGNLDSASPEGVVEGWCWSPDEPDVHRIVAVLVNGAEVATAACNRPRSDLAQAGFGSGAHAFHAAVPATARSPGATDMVTLRELATGEPVGGPLMVTWTAAPVPGRPAFGPEPVLPPQGNVDAITRDGRVSGWCWYPDAPHRAVRLAITVDGEVVGLVLANMFRPDLRDAGIGSGEYGYSFALPWQVLSSKGLLTVSVRDEATGDPIGLPQTLRLGRMSEAQDRLAELERQIRALRTQIGELTANPGGEGGARAQEVFAGIGALFDRLAGTAPARPSWVSDLALQPRAALQDAIAALRQRHKPFMLDAPEHPRASIALPVQAGMEALYQCLLTLRLGLADQQADIVLIDDSRGASAEASILPAIVGNLRYLRPEEGADVSACLTGLARLMRTEFLVYLAPGLSPGAHWLQVLLDSFAAEPGAALIGCQVTGRDGLLRHAGLVAGPDGVPVAAGVLSDASRPEWGRLRPVDGVGALAFAVRREALLAAGGFRPGFASLGHATLDLCLRLRAAGHAVLIQPDAAMICEDHFDPAAHVPDLNAGDEDGLRLRRRWVG